MGRVNLWDERAVPLLKYIAAHETEGRAVTIGELADETGIAPEQIVPEVERLIDGSYIPGALTRSYSGGDSRPWFLTKPRLTDKGARAIRIWPEVDDLLATLKAQAEEEADPTRKTKLQALLGAARAVGTDVLSEVLAAAFKRAAGLP